MYILFVGILHTCAQCVKACVAHLHGCVRPLSADVITFYTPEAVILTSEDFAPQRGAMHQRCTCTTCKHAGQSLQALAEGPVNPDSVANRLLVLGASTGKAGSGTTLTCPYPGTILNPNPSVTLIP